VCAQKRRGGGILGKLLKEKELGLEGGGIRRHRRVTAEGRLRDLGFWGLSTTHISQRRKIVKISMAKGGKSAGVEDCEGGSVRKATPKQTNLASNNNYSKMGGESSFARAESLRLRRRRRSGEWVYKWKGGIDARI